MRVRSHYLRCDFVIVVIIVGFVTFIVGFLFGWAAMMTIASAHVGPYDVVIIEGNPG